MINATYFVLLVAGTCLILKGIISPVVTHLSKALAMNTIHEATSNGTYPTRDINGKTALWVSLALILMTIVLMFVKTPTLGILNTVRIVSLVLLLWKNLTQDFDVARTLNWQIRDRCLILLIGIASVTLPWLTFVTVVLLCGRLGAWTHHSKALIRILKIYVAWSLVTMLIGNLMTIPESTSLAVLLLIQVEAFLSHYVSACWHKLVLGPRPWSWVLENDTGLLVAAAYEWGWARFINRRFMTKVISTISYTSPFLNACTLIFEGVGIVAFFSLHFCIVAVLCCVCFSIIVAITSGLFFWENILIGITLTYVLGHLSSNFENVVFGIMTGSVGVILSAIIIIGIPWRATVLAWWDTGMSTRVYWKAVTENGQTFGLYNTFMSPHDREYGRSVGNVVVNVPFLTYSMGGVENLNVRNAIRSCISTKNIYSFLEIKKNYSWTDYKEEARIWHVNYMNNLFRSLNNGKRKKVFPYPLSFLKAPSGHLYGNGDYPPYTCSKGKVEKVEVWVRETFYQPEAREWYVIFDKLAFSIKIDSANSKQNERDSLQTFTPYTFGFHE